MPWVWIIFLAVASTKPASTKLHNRLVLAMAVGGAVGGVKSEVYTAVPITCLRHEIYPLHTDTPLLLDPMVILVDDKLVP